MFIAQVNFGFHYLIDHLYTICDNFEEIFTVVYKTEYRAIS